MSKVQLPLEMAANAAVSSWRDRQPLTAGLVAQWLRMEFTGLAFRDGFNRKSAIFTFPEQRGDPRLRVAPLSAATRMYFNRFGPNYATIPVTQG